MARTDGASPTNKMERVGRPSLRPDSRASRRGRVNLYTVIICCIVAQGGFLFGYDSGNIAGVMQMDMFIKLFGHRVADNTPPRFGAIADIHGEKFTITPVYKSLITSFLSIGTFIGALAGGWMADNLGRKGSILISGVVFCCGVVIQTASETVPTMIVGRLVAGLGVGVISMSTPCYLSEASPPRLRGSLVSVYQLAITAGIAVAQALDWATSNILTSASWRIPIGLQLLWGAILLASCAVIPESPRYLVKRGYSSEALQSLAKMRAGGETTIAVREEYSEILNNLEFELAYGEGTYMECFRRKNRRRTMLGLCVQMFQQFTGINFLFYYGTTFFENAGLPNPYLITFLTGIINVLFTLPGIWAVERLGRRPLLMAGAAWMCICELLIALVATVQRDHKAANIVLTVFECCFIAGFASTWGPGAWVLTGEVFPLKLRGKGMSLSAASNWGWNWVLTFTAPYMSDHGYGGLGSKIAFVWAGTCFAAFCWSWAFVPETRYLSLEELDELFEAHLPAWQTRSFQPTGLTIQDQNTLRRQRSYASQDQDYPSYPSWQRDVSPSRTARSGGSRMSAEKVLPDTHSLHSLGNGRSSSNQPDHVYQQYIP